MIRSVYLWDGTPLFAFDTSVRTCIYIICEASYRIFYLFSFWYWWKSSGWLPTALLCYRDDFSFLHFVYYYSFLQCEYAQPNRHAHTHRHRVNMHREKIVWFGHVVALLPSLPLVWCAYDPFFHSHSDMQHFVAVVACSTIRTEFTSFTSSIIDNDGIHNPLTLDKDMFDELNDSKF